MDDAPYRLRKFIGNTGSHGSGFILYDTKIVLSTKIRFYCCYMSITLVLTFPLSST